MKNYSVLYALLAAVLFGINAPFSKLLINELNPFVDRVHFNFVFLCVLGF